jgi:hypothetical protein
MSDRQYVTTSPTTIEDFLAKTKWVMVDEEDGMIEDMYGTVAYIMETDDGHLELFVEDGDDVSDIIEVVSFHLKDPEEYDDEI